MTINIKTPGVHHVELRVSDYDSAKRFYVETLGFQIILEKPNVFIFLVGGTAIGIAGPETDTPKDDRFNPFRVGLDHIALTVRTRLSLSGSPKPLQMNM